MEAGDTLQDRYQLRELIARGGMGEVWLAFDSRLEREVAVKFGGVDPEAPALLEEGRAAASLDHPNIVAVHDVDSQNGEPFIVMEYVPGRSLREVLQDQGPLPEAEALRIGGEVLAALSYAHSRGVWHNDVKPENILIAPDGTARLTDFGVASVNSPTIEITAGRRIFATVPYAAPEVLAGSPAGPAADLYATAVTLYECVTGFVPARAAGNASAPAPLREVVPQASAGLESVMSRALDPNPGARYPTSSEFRRALANVRPGIQPTVRITSAAAAPVAAAAGGHAILRRLGFGTALVAIVGLGLGLMLWTLLGGRSINGTSIPNPGEEDAALADSEPTAEPTEEPTQVPAQPSGATVLYFHNGPAPGNTAAQSNMPMTAEPGPDVPLPNYSADNDDRPGRSIDEDDKGAAQDDQAKYANWLGSPTSDLDFNQPHQVTVTFWFAEVDWDRGEDGRFEVWLRKVDGSGSVNICSGAQDVTSPGGQGSWAPVQISFSCSAPVTVSSSETLEVKVTLNENSASGDGEDMMIAYGTATFDANIRIEPPDSGQSTEPDQQARPVPVQQDDSDPAQIDPVGNGGAQRLIDQTWEWISEFTRSTLDSIRP